MQEVFAPVSADGLGDGVEDRNRAVERRLAALARCHPGDDVRAVLLHRPAVELALAAGDAVDDQPRLGSDEDAHAAAPRDAATALAAASSRRGGRREVRLLEQRRGLGLVGADDPHDHRDVASLLCPRFDEPARDLVSAGDAAEDVDEDGGRPSGRRG